MSKEKNRLNVFQQTYLPLRYPANWIRNWRIFYRQFKWAWQRATRGFCDYDVWDLDCYLLDLLHATLNKLAATANGYPGNDEYPTYESWTQDLRELAQKFYQANECNDFYPTPKESIWWEAVKNKENWIDEDTHTWKDPVPDCSKDMLAEEIDNGAKRQQDFEEAWEKLGKIFFSLWD